jgi:hypothetical protein
MRRCHELRRKPVEDFTVEDLRIMIGQAIGLDALVPIALSTVEDNPLAAGDYYEGDLLVSLVGIPNAYWADHPDDWFRLRDIAGRVAALASVLDRAKVFLESSKGGA